MPDTMLERIARALYERFPHGQLISDAQGRQALSGIPWDDLSDGSRQRWLDDARAVLIAMREATDRMVTSQRILAGQLHMG